MDYQSHFSQWSDISGTEGWRISEACWIKIIELVKPGFQTLETGSGLSTWLFGMLPCQHIALEDRQATCQQIMTRELNNVQLICRSLYGRPLWYNWVPDGRKDLILIDGPAGRIGREGILQHVDALSHPETIWIIDDTYRPRERELAEKIAERSSLAISDHHWFSVLEKT